MKDKTYASNLKDNFLINWDNIGKIKKPLIAAVNGYAVSSTAFFRVKHCWNKCDKLFDAHA